MLAADLTQRHPLKAYDAVQLAVALSHVEALKSHGEIMTFLSHDQAQLKAGQAEGLLVLDPANPQASRI